MLRLFPTCPFLKINERESKRTDANAHEQRKNGGEGRGVFVSVGN